MPSHWRLAALLVLVACSGEPEELDPKPALRPGAAILFDAGPTAIGNPLTTQHHLVRVNDVVRDGKRTIVELASGWTSLATFHPPAPNCSSCSTTIGSASGGNGYVVVTTDDDGNSWKTRALALPTDLRNVLAYGSAGFHAAAGRVTWVLLVQHNGAASEQLRDVDLDAGVALANPALANVSLFQARAFGTSIVSRRLDMQPPARQSGQLVKAQYDLATGQFSQQGQAVTGPAWSMYTAAAASLDGQTYRGIGVDEENGQACLLEASGIARPEPQACVDFTRWPAYLRHPATAAYTSVLGDTSHLVAGADAIWALSVHGSQLVAMPVDAPFDPARAIALGEGAFEPDVGLHPRFGTFVKVGPQRLVALAVGAARDVVIPPPCEPGSQCALAAELEAVVPLAGDEVLALWKVDTMAGIGHHEYVIARKETVTYRPLALPLPALGTSPLAYYPSAKPAPPLIQRCSLGERCGMTGSWLTCYRRFAGLAPQNPALVTFLSGAATTCAELAARWPEGALFGKPCQLGCVGNVAVTSCDGDRITVADGCARYGATCASTGGRASCTVGGSALSCGPPSCAGDVLVGCTQNESCAASGRSCGLHHGTATCTKGPCSASSCSGDLLTLCESDGVAFDVDCALDGQTCGRDEAGVTRCVPRAPLDFGDCGGTPGHPVDVWEPVCIGNRYLAWCGKGERLYVDCHALGGTGCGRAVGSIAGCR